MDASELDPIAAKHGLLLGPAARPVLIAVIERLRPDLDSVAVGGAVEQIVLCSEETHDLGVLWAEVEAALKELAENIAGEH